MNIFFFYRFRVVEIVPSIQFLDAIRVLPGERALCRWFHPALRLSFLAKVCLNLMILTRDRGSLVSCLDAFSFISCF